MVISGDVAAELTPGTGCAEEEEDEEEQAARNNAAPKTAKLIDATRILGGRCLEETDELAVAGDIDCYSRLPPFLDGEISGKIAISKIQTVFQLRSNG